MKKFIAFLLLSLALLSCDGQIAIMPTYNRGAQDFTRPTMAVETSSVSPVGGSILVEFNASEPTVAFISTDPTLVNCTLSNFTQVEEGRFTATITPTVEGTFTIQVAVNKFTDRALNYNTASNLLSLEYSTGVPFDPANADLWLDGTQAPSSGITEDTDNLIRTGLTSSDAGAYVFTSLSPGGYRMYPQYNGEGLYWNGQTGLSGGSTSDFKAYHSNSFTIYYIFKQLPQVSTSRLHLFSTTSTSTLTGNSQTGIRVTYLNRSFETSICNGGGGTAPFIVTGTSNAVTENSYNILKIVYNNSTTTLQAWVKPFGGSYTSIGSDNTLGSALSTGNSTTALNIGAAASVSGTPATQKGYFKHLIAFKRTLTASDETAIEAFLDTEAADVITPTNVNVYMWFGQSNNGSAANSGLVTPPASGTLLGAHNYFMPSTSNSYKGGFWAQMKVPDNHNMSSSLGNHGYQVRFGYEMNQLASTYLVGRWAGSTALVPSGGGSSWSAQTSVNNSDYYPYWMDGFYVTQSSTNSGVVMDALEEIIHVKRKTPIIRGLIFCIGETDSGNASLTQADWYGEANAFINTTMTKIDAAGYTNKTRVAILRTIVTSGSGSSAVRAAQAQVVSNIASNMPTWFHDSSYAVLIDTDGYGRTLGDVHYNGSGQNAGGLDLFNYFKLYISE